jgi:hypothetical protein
MSLTPRYPNHMPTTSTGYPTAVVAQIGDCDLTRRAYTQSSDSWFLVRQGGFSVVRLSVAGLCYRPEGIDDETWTAIVTAINLLEPA